MEGATPHHNTLTLLLLDFVNLLEQLRLESVEVLVEREDNGVGGNAPPRVVDLVHPLKEHLNRLSNRLGQGTPGCSLLTQHNSL